MTDIHTKTLSRRLFQIRKTGARGTPILMHRALRNIPLTPMSLLSILVLPLFFDLVLWKNLDVIMKLWADIFSFWAQHLSLVDNLAYTDIQIFRRTFSVIYLSMPLNDISAYSVWVNLLVCAVLALITYVMPKRFMPLITLLRAAILIQISASIYCFISRYTFPYTTQGYLSGVLSLGAYLLFIISPVLAFIYYIFNFSFVKKASVTAVIIAYFVIIIPFLYTLHALIISVCGLLLMPVLYLMFGPLLITLMFVSFYAWAMTRKMPVVKAF